MYTAHYEHYVVYEQYVVDQKKRLRYNLLWRVKLGS